MKDSAKLLKRRLKNVGLSDSAIKAAWPTWWSEDADASPSAQTELRLSLSRKLGLDPHSLLEDNEEPRFVWRNEARFKHLSDEGLIERSAITSFGTILGRYLIDATTVVRFTDNWNSISLRNAILANQPFVRLIDLVSSCWSLGFPVIHLRIFPCTRKRMSAMSVRVGDRYALMLGEDSMYPPHVAFYLAHELAHVALGHLTEKPLVVDLEHSNLSTSNDDPEEVAADRFALELLTGRTQPKILPLSEKYSARALANVALKEASKLAIEPGTLALCFGFSTNDWATANAAMRFIYEAPRPVWIEINKVALNHFNFDLVPDDVRAYLKAILGEPNPG